MGWSPILLFLAAQSGLDAPTPPKVIAARFVAEWTGGRGAFVGNAVVPHRPDSCYRWEIDVEPEDRGLVVREDFVLPAAAPQWGGADGAPGSPTRVDPDRSGATTLVQESLEDGKLTHGWCVAEGDPLGQYVISVHAGDVLLHRFRFQVVRETY